MVGFYLHNRLEMIPFQRWRTDQWLPEVGEEAERAGGCDYSYEKATEGL